MRSQRDPVPRRIVATAGALGVAAASFATVNLATAKVQQSDVQQAISRGEAGVVDPSDLGTPGEGGDPPASTPDTGAGSNQPPDDGPTTTAAPTTTTTAPPRDDNDNGGQQNGNPPRTTTTTTTTAPPSPSGSMWAIGDSVMRGAATSLNQYGFKVTAEVGYYFSSGIQAVKQIIANDDLGDVVVIHLGANGPISTDEMDEMMELLAEVPNVLLLNVYTAGGYHFQYDVGPTNALIAQTAEQYDNVKLLDWNAVAGGCKGNCFASDNLHLSEDGADYYALQIAKALGLA